MTDIESIRKYCLSLPRATEDMAFGEDYLLFRVCGKIFACCALTGTDYFVVKCDADYALDLRDRYPDITPAWHWNKRYWNQLSLRGTLSGAFICELIRHSYSQVVAKLPRSVRVAFPEVTAVHP